jgi:long-chain acyl-CoA synthetase
MPVDPISIADAFRARVASQADASLVLAGDASLTFAQVDRASDGVAASLVGGGIAPGDRVGLYCPNVPEFVVAYLGIIKAGAVVVPVNLLIQPREVAYILDDAGAKGLIHHAALADKVAAVRPQLSQVTLWCGIGGVPSDPADLDFAAMVVAAPPTSWPTVDPLNDLAAILYTSGTTGFPKGAMLSHHNLVSNTRSVLAGLQLRPGEDRLLVVLPMFHSFAATVGMLTPALHGLALVPVPRFDPTLVSDCIAAERATVFLGVPSMYGLILRIDDDQAAKWASIRFGVAGGAAMPVELMSRFEQRFGFPILEGDGPTECSPVTCVNPIDGVRKPGSVGLPVPDVSFRILNDAGEALATGEIGEICVRGPNVMQGYWGLPEETAETFAGEWLRTGDLGYLDEDGYLFMVDRKKDMIIVNGMNVYPRMIEEVLYAHPDVVEAAVIGEPHGSHGEIVVAYLVGREGQQLSGRALRDYCREHLGPHQMPRRFEIRESLPKNATGKILKRELRRAGEIDRGVDSERDSGH